MWGEHDGLWMHFHSFATLRFAPHIFIDLLCPSLAVFFAAPKLDYPSAIPSYWFATGLDRHFTLIFRSSASRDPSLSLSLVPDRLSLCKACYCRMPPNASENQWCPPRFPTERRKPLEFHFQIRASTSSKSLYSLCLSLTSRSWSSCQTCSVIFFEICVDQ